MFVYIAVFIGSLIPSILIIVLLKRRRKTDLDYRKSCNSAILRGLLAVLPIMVVSGTLFALNGILRATVLKNIDYLVYRALYDFIVLAFAEELVKFLGLRLLLKKRFNAYIWADVVAFMVIIGTGFGLVESVTYAIGSDPMFMIVRGLTLGHVGYAFIMGWFYGKKLHTGKKRYGVLAFLIPFLLHGLYDFSLTPELIAINDNLTAIAFGLAVFDIVLVILMIRFFIRSKKKEIYNVPLVEKMQVTQTPIGFKAP